MSRPYYKSWCLQYMTPSFINVMILHSFVSRVGEYNIGKVKGLKRIEKVREIEETIGEIK